MFLILNIGLCIQRSAQSFDTIARDRGSGGQAALAELSCRLLRPRAKNRNGCHCAPPLLSSLLGNRVIAINSPTGNKNQMTPRARERGICARHVVFFLLTSGLAVHWNSLLVPLQSAGVLSNKGRFMRVTYLSYYLRIYTSGL